MNHRIPAEQMIVEGDRREIGIEPINARGRSNTRSAPHDYSKPLCIVYVPVEPEPDYLPATKEFSDGWSWNAGFKGRWNEGDIEVFKAHLVKYCPFSPQDKIIATEEYEVIKVLGVEALKGKMYWETGTMSGAPVSGVYEPKKWYFKLLCEETK